MVTDNRTTKVYYYLDDSTPYMSIIPVSSEVITLSDFKKVFNRRGYNYFCKEFDADLKQEVKVEITSDLQKLHKSANGLIELFLLSQNSNVNATNNNRIPSSGTLPKVKRNPLSASTIDFPVPGFKLNKRRSSIHALSSIADEMDVGGGQRVSMVTNDRSISGEASSDINTLVSKRAGEHLAELYTSTSEDHYKFDGISAPSYTSSNNYRPLLIHSYTREDNETIEDNESFTAHQHTYRYTSTSSQQNIKQRKPRKQRYRKAYVPSTISSASESSLSFSLPRVDEVKLRLQDSPKLGISVGCHDGGVFISKIQPGSAAEKCGQLEVGDQIVQIENVSFENLSDEQAVEELRKASFMKRTITIYVAKRPRMSDQRSDALSLLCETMQMDVSLWVEQTTKQDRIEPVSMFNNILNTEIKIGSDQGLQQNLMPNNVMQQNGSRLNFNGAYNNLANDTSIAAQTSNMTGLDSDNGAVTSDEERAAYADRRNGVGSRLVPALQNKKRAVAAVTAAAAVAQQQFQQQQQPQNNKCVIAPSYSYNAPTNKNTVPPSTTLSFRKCGIESLKNETHLEPLNISLDPLTILKRMARPDSGLVIKNRKWLKIPVLNSFIGDEMIDWLLHNVTGFRDRKAAKAYALILLTNGYIKHVVNMSNFNEKCYYIFKDSIIEERLRLQQQQQMVSQSTLTSFAATASTSTRVGAGLIPNGSGESTTEVTYMSSPSSPFLANNSISVNNTAQLPPKPSNSANGVVSNSGGIMIKVANNPRYVSPPKQMLRNEIALRLNNNINVTNDKNNNLMTLVGMETPLISHNPNTTWPISPIPMYGNNSNNNNLRDCDSPAITNDYASMIQGEINSNANSHFNHIENATIRLKENNPPQLLPLPSSNNDVGEGLLPSSVPPPAPNQRPLLSKNLF